jgi:DNA-binding winged helix-turn-helix (wHTH) protein
MLQAEIIPDEIPAKRNALICPCCLQFVEGATFLTDPVNCLITNGDKTIKLTRRQFKLAKYLLDCFPLVATKDSIYDNVYLDEHGEGPGMKVMDVVVCHIRPALAEVGLVIETIWGKGYKVIQADPSEALLIKDRSIRERQLGSHRRWSQENDTQLLELMRRKMKVAQIAAIMKMPYMTVERHFRKLAPLVEARV